MTQPTGDDPLAALKPYVQLASGLMGMSAAKAAEFAQGFLSPGADEDAGGAAEADADVVSVERVRSIAREEVDRAARRLGFVREDELASIRREVDRLERQVAHLDARLADLSTQASGGTAPPSAAAVKKAKKKSGSKKNGGE